MINHSTVRCRLPCVLSSITVMGRTLRRGNNYDPEVILHQTPRSRSSSRLHAVSYHSIPCALTSPLARRRIDSPTTLCIRLRRGIPGVRCIRYSFDDINDNGPVTSWDCKCWSPSAGHGLVVCSSNKLYHDRLHRMYIHARPLPKRPSSR